MTLSDNVRSVRQLRKWEYVSEKDGTLSESLHVRLSFPLVREVGDTGR